MERLRIGTESVNIIEFRSVLSSRAGAPPTRILTGSVKLPGLKTTSLTLSASEQLPQSRTPRT